MRLLYIILLTIILSSCEQKKDDLDAVTKSIKEQYRGDVRATIQKESQGLAFLLLELKDTLPNSSSNSETERATRLVKSAFYSMSDVQRTSVDLIKITFSNRTETYFKNEVSIKDLVKDDSIRQIEYCDLLPNILSSQGLAIHMDEITKLEFDRIAPELLKRPQPINTYNHNDSLENVLKLTFHDKFRFEEGCYSFDIGNEQVIKFCRRNNPNNDRGFEYYNLIDRFEEFFIFEVTRYEDWEFVIFDSNSGRTYLTSGYPKFSYSKKYMYSVTGYYGEAIISIHRLTDNKGIAFSFDNWDALENYWINEEGIRFKLKSTICRQGSRYVDCHFAN